MFVCESATERGAWLQVPLHCRKPVTTALLSLTLLSPTSSPSQSSSTSPELIHTLLHVINSFSAAFSTGIEAQQDSSTASASDESQHYSDSRHRLSSAAATDVARQQQYRQNPSASSSSEQEQQLGDTHLCNIKRCSTVQQLEYIGPAACEAASVLLRCCSLSLSDKAQQSNFTANVLAACFDSLKVSACSVFSFNCNNMKVGAPRGM